MWRVTADGRVWVLRFAAAFVLGAAALPAQASQRPYPVVALSCAADLHLCRALVQALAETVPGHIYRINPEPTPPQAFALALDLSRSGQARLRWQGGAGDLVTRAGLSQTDLARHLVQASPDLPRALTRDFKE